MAKTKAKDEGIDFSKMTLNFYPLNYTVEVVLTENPLAYARHVGYTEGDRHGTVSALCLYFDSDMRSTIIVDYKATPGTIAHEAWHAVRRMLLHIKADLDNEIVAYHLGYLVGEIHKYQKEKLKERKKKK